MRLLFKVLFGFYFVLLTVQAPRAHAQDQNFESWTHFQYNRSIHGMISNLSPNGTRPGVVIASPSRNNPPYFYHWVRDAALVMSSALELFTITPDPSLRQLLGSSLLDYMAFEKHLQSLSPLGGLGEPKFNVDGTTFNGEWGRPQNDGPALRALTMMKLARILWQERQYELVHNYIYNPRAATDDNASYPGLVPTDLDYVANVWNQPDFDLWEEVMGQHFYTLVVQRRALLEGAEFSLFMGDRRRAQFYRTQAARIEGHLMRHQNHAQGTIAQHINIVGGIRYKGTGLDAATALAVNHTYGQDSFLNVADPWVLNTLFNLEQAFRDTYPLNQNQSHPAAIGRYPEDRYYGGHPWFLTTLAYAEHHYKLVEFLTFQDSFAVNNLNLQFILNIAPELAGLIKPGDVLSTRSQAMERFLVGLKNRADGYFARVQRHSGRNGSMDEQYHRVTGFMLSARDLTWSYSSYVTAYHARQRALQRLGLR